MIRFIFGPSGAGKSTTVYRELIERSLREPERRFFVLVPDQFTMQTQADVVRMHPQHGIMNIDVLSFSRLAHRVFDETGRPAGTLLDDLGKTLLLRYVAGRIRRDIPLIGPHIHKAGYLDEVKSTLSELMQYDIPPEKMDVLLAASRGRKLLHGKLKDLQTLYAAFRDALQNAYLTAEDTCSIVERRILETGFARDAVVVADAFTGFTPVQYRVLRALYAVCEELTVTVTIGAGEDPYRTEPLEGGGLFALGKKTVRDLARHCHAWDAQENPKDTPPFDRWEEYRRKTAHDVFLEAGEQSRLHGNKALAFLERNLFCHKGESFPEEPESIRLFAALTPAEEARQVFREIRRLLREDDTLQYRDFAVLSADFETGADLLSARARDFSIPVYEDKTRSIRNNPLNGYLSAIPEIVRTNFSQESVMQYLRSVLSFCARKDADVLERYLFSNGIRGKRRWEKPFTETAPRDRVRRTDEETCALLETLESVRTAFLERLMPLWEAGKNGTVRDMTRALYSVLQKDGAEQKLLETAGQLEEAGDPAGAAEYRQVFGRVVNLLEDMVKLLGDERVPVREYAQILDAGLSGLQVGTIPQNVDRVLTGDLQRTRLKEVKVLFLCGASDRAIPHRNTGGGLLSEIDRDFLREHCAEVELAPSPAGLLTIERLYLYMNLTKPSRALYLSCAAVDETGKSARPSYLFGEFSRMFPAAKVRLPERDALAEQTETRQDAVRRMGVLMRRYAAGLSGTAEDAALIPLFQLLAGDDTGMRLIRKAAFTGYRKRTLSPALARTLYEAVKKASASRLELFAACPYAHFVRYGLRLTENTEYDFNASDLGNVYHGVLEMFSRRLAEENLSWADVTDRKAESLVHETVHAFAAEYGNAVLFDTERMLHRLLRVEQVLVRTVKTLRYQLQQGSFLPLAAEEAFLRFVRDGDDTMELYGRIDRVDTAENGDSTCVKVIDFKSGRRDFDITLLYHGLQLQLMLYMDAALGLVEKKGKHAVPGAMLYYHITDPLVDLDGEDAERIRDTEIDALLKRSLRTTGIVNADDAVIRLLDGSFAGTSDVIPVKRNKNGALSASSSVFDEGDYEAMSVYTRNLITSFYKRIRQGDIEISPYALKGTDACKWCAYRGICAFDETTRGYRFRKPEELSRTETLACIRKAAETTQEEKE